MDILILPSWLETNQDINTTRTHIFDFRRALPKKTQCHDVSLTTSTCSSIPITWPVCLYCSVTYACHTITMINHNNNYLRLRNDSKPSRCYKKERITRLQSYQRLHHVSSQRLCKKPSSRDWSVGYIRNPTESHKHVFLYVFTFSKCVGLSFLPKEYAWQHTMRLVILV